ncbi:cobyrinic acid a,c-diamide synthase [Gordoniibacillus kamchatkensis]|uniref:Cobyrinate a,c-diamide synthase n=1 Tax=Gordoniibacillus kamchatkensis TaxID=1590651 RepID=A0ABR5AC70_9BACL|nr:cobyrinate a,c-diamide synthase [Paenibacillus sp. VKM B-2647]KIL38655.1 cobyrinic acid a,c-diamide synthase [Paenibacillus sp. VKM B-2647]
MQNRILIAGTGSGVGKTTLTIGLMAALRQKGYNVQGFKCGPDYIDPTYHTAVTGRQSRNLDSWMLSRDTVKDIFRRASSEADISVIEGVMGLFDGKNHLSNEGSAADIAGLLQCPIVLVVNCHSMGRSAAAVVKGFQHFAADVNIAGIIANKVGSEGHYRMVKEAVMQECGLPVFGYLLRDDALEIPERHLGLVPSVERGELEPFFAKLAQQVAATVDVEAIVKAAVCPDLPAPESEGRLSVFEPRPQAHGSGVRLAVARDAAFNFYYPENLELLQACGAELRFFSPLAGETVPPDADGLYIGGGFPEEFAATLAAGSEVKASIRAFIERGKPVLAECGGFMYLTEAIVDTEGRRYDMVSAIPGQVAMQKKLASFGYREIQGTDANYLLQGGIKARGHEFHYSTYQCESANPAAYITKGRKGEQEEGVLHRRLVAGYTHIHFASAPEMAQRFVDECAQVKSTEG